MYRIDNATATGSLPAPGPVGPTVDGYFAPGVTTVDGDFLNAVMEEIAYAIEQSPGSPALSKTDRTQLKTAIDAYITNAAAPAVRLAECTLITGDIGAGAGALTPTNAFNVSSASKTNPNVNSDLVTINFTTTVTTPYHVFVEWFDNGGAVHIIHVPTMITKGSGTLVFRIDEALAGVQNGTVKVLILNTSNML